MKRHALCVGVHLVYFQVKIWWRRKCDFKTII